MINTRYEILKKLGEGRSKVFLCRDIEFPEKEYAIKILPADVHKRELDTFVKEYFTLQRLEHSNIIEAYELGTVLHFDGEEEIEIGSTFMTLEYFEGEVLQSSNSIRDDKILREITRQICAALYYLHQSKYIYYDLKSENILISFRNGQPVIKLIDLGLAEYSPSPSDYEIKGTAYYIAPELLKKENHNHSVDFYSLGILLYQVVYNHFPFKAKTELDIYKSAIESSFEYPASDIFSKEIIDILKRLLEKDTDKRYSSALAIIKDLGFQIDLALTKEFLPAKVYSSRESTLEALFQFLDNTDSSEVYTIKGFDGVGKSSLLHKILEQRNEAVIISEVRGKTSEELIRFIIRQMIFSKAVYPNLNAENQQMILRFLSDGKKKEIDELKQITAAVASQCTIILLIDDFNLYDQLTSNFLLEVIPLLQVNNSKVIVNESQGHELLSSSLNNVKEVTLGPFTNSEMFQFLEESYSKEVPIAELKELIITNADLIPGNIKAFIKDLILFGIMHFSASGVSFTKDENKISALTEAHFSIYDLRLANLSEKEFSTVKIISALEIFIDLQLLSLLVDISKAEAEGIASSLQLNNIVQKFSSGQTLIFTSEAIKKYIYASVDNKKDFHLHIAKKFSAKVPSIYRVEEARQYELAGDYNKSCNLSLEEINEAEKRSAFSYMKKLLLHLIQLPLKKTTLDALKIKLSEVYFKLGDVQSSLNTIKELKSTIAENKIDKKISSIEGSALIASGEYETGKKVISDLLGKISDTAEIHALKVELAYADFELKLYDKAQQQCDLLLNDKSLSPELAGRCYNLKGMIDIYQSNNLNSALENFQTARSKFFEAGQSSRVAGAEVNIGNVYSMQKEYDKAEFHWKSASEINQSIGSLEQEGILLQSMGVFYYDRIRYESAIHAYKKADIIFLNLGKDLRRAQILWNLGEVYLSLCEYQKVIESIDEARKLFEKLENKEEMLDLTFLLGRMYYKIGFNDKLIETYNEFISYFSLLNQPDNYQILKEFFEQWIAFIGTGIILPDKMEYLRQKFLSREDIKNYLECVFLTTKFHIHHRQFKEALIELKRTKLMELCSQNSILEAEREYFLGIISKNFRSEKLLPPMVYFEKSYELIKNDNIIELTWQVLYEISELYIDRGNLNKAKQFITYTRELIYFIGERIHSPRVRAAYLRQQDRLNTLKKLESFYPQS
ncbi:MAG: protein kinase [bacterium]|nr:protein kinase [bacterium]